tara:strand:- start:27 stop:590 length:564 start_codon:yes stop_codon:yes gene_type:complete
MDYKALYEQSQKENEKLKKEMKNYAGLVCLPETLEKWQKAGDENFNLKLDIEELKEENEKLKKEKKELREWVDRNQEEIDRLRLVIDESDEEDDDDWETMYGGSWDGTKYTVIMAGGSIDAWQYEIYPRHIMKVYPCQNRQERVTGCKLVANPEEREDQVKLVGINYTNKDGEEDFYELLKGCGMLA